MAKRARSARTGRFITMRAAKARPNTSVVETIKRHRKRKNRKTGLV